MQLSKMPRVFYCFVVCVITQYAYALQPLPQSFDELVIVLLPDESQEQFRHYYRTKIDQLKSLKSPLVKKKQLAQLKKTAFNALEVHHPKWALEVAPALSGSSEHGSSDQRVYTNILIQYGIYVQFVRYTATQKSSMWSKAIIKKDAVKNRISSWIGTRKEKKA